MRVHSVVLLSSISLSCAMYVLGASWPTTSDAMSLQQRASGMPMDIPPTSPPLWPGRHVGTVDEYIGHSGPLLLPHSYLVTGADDVVVGPDEVGATFDELAQAALPDGDGVVVMGEVHQHAGTHRFYRQVLAQSAALECVFLEYPAELQHHIDAYLSGRPCDETWLVAESQVFTDSSRACAPNMRRRLLDTLADNRRQAWAVDVSYTHGPVAEWRREHATDGNDRAILTTNAADLILDTRNQFMARQISQVIDNDHCGLGFVQTGRAHALELDLPASGRILPMEDRLQEEGVPSITWPVVDATAELTGDQAPFWTAARFVVDQGKVVAVILEDQGHCPL